MVFSIPLTPRTLARRATGTLVPTIPFTRLRNSLRRTASEVVSRVVYESDATRVQYEFYVSDNEEEVKGEEEEEEDWDSGTEVYSSR